MTDDMTKIAGQLSLLISYVRGAIDAEEDNSQRGTVLIKIQMELREMAQTLIPDHEIFKNERK